MSLKSMLSLIDDKLKATFDIVPFDAEKARQPLLKSVDNAKAQFTEGRTRIPHRQWQVANDVVEYDPSTMGHPILIADKPVNYIPSSRFVDFLDAFKAAIEKGEFDDQLKKISEDREAGKTVATPKSPRRQSSGGGGREWSPERRAAYEATIAARKAAKQG